MAVGNGRKRDHRIYIRMSDNEYSFLKNQVKKSGLSIQDYVLRAINSSTVISSDISEKLMETNRCIGRYSELMREMGYKISETNKRISCPGVSEVINSISLQLSAQLKEADVLWQSIRSLIVRLKTINPL